MDSDQEEFELTFDERPRDRFGRPHRAPPDDRSGRKQGAVTKTTRQIRQLLESRGINFLHKMWDRAERCEDEGDLKCAFFIGSRVWTKPRGNLLTVDLSSNVDARSLLMAMCNGQITPADASSLWNSLGKNGNGHSEVSQLGPPQTDVRERIAQRLAKIVADKQGAPINNPEPEDEPDADDAQWNELMAKARELGYEPPPENSTPEDDEARWKETMDMARKLGFDPPE